ncbi:monovalent cation:proton antiporter-2 (CPA2) family protein [Larsenimonas rhizosphaerae]|uniref:monovalent cation:proton antiporter-2 (CPA2) family protein n=1 Tax=Larsenimonas rhizosphaerae TaxID=2944682 RepID=UPI0020341B60|nr:monovalent cation:proton antiporter-2 (CPA2) family protein [Larsenimonas rhizosphaerae]MCM2130718.1 monovalent cation:proton antiporter-2 (CPA2) family protein [Larsenimonas rhizosphaerae]
MPFLLEAALLLGAAIIAVPVFQRLGLGSILGYLFVGILFGPSLLKVFSEPEAVLHFAEFGVVMLLFVIGLELEPKRLWRMRLRLMGLGSAQMVISGLLLASIGWLLQLELGSSLLLGFILALSSTAFALQVLNENKHLTTAHGQSAFSMLLFQDLAVIPLLAVLPLFAGGALASSSELAIGVLRSAGTVIAAILVGRFIFPRVLRLVARSELHEVFTAAALFMVLAMALLMEWAGLSMALGAFLAGVLLADTVYRHELEANIEPFKGILLGLFFIGVGMSINLVLVGENILLVLAITVLLLLIKTAILATIGWLTRLPRAEIPPLAAILSQGGEFDFVLLTAGVSAGVFSQRVASLCIAAVTISMALTPFLYRLALRWGHSLAPKRSFDTADNDETPPVLIAGLGRVGQMIARILKLQGINFTALDPNIKQVEFIRKFGSRIYYADASRHDLLRSAGAEQAKVLVIAVDDPQATLDIARMAKQHFPHLEIYARARNRHHAWQLMELGVTHLVRETFGASMEMSGDILRGLGFPSANAAEAVRTFRDFDNELFRSSYRHRNDNDALLESDRVAMNELYALFQKGQKADEERKERRERKRPQEERTTTDIPQETTQEMSHDEK